MHSRNRNSQFVALQVSYLVAKDCMRPLVDTLEAPNLGLVERALEGLEVIMEVRPKARIV